MLDENRSRQFQRRDNNLTDIEGKFRIAGEQNLPVPARRQPQPPPTEKIVFVERPVERVVYRDAPTAPPSYERAPNEPSYLPDGRPAWTFDPYLRQWIPTLDFDRSAQRRAENNTAIVTFFGYIGLGIAAFFALWGVLLLISYLLRACLHA